MSDRDPLAEALSRLRDDARDEQAWRQIYRGFYPFVIAVIYRTLGGGGRLAAEDAAQEVFIRLVRLADFRAIANVDALRGYVWRIARNVAIDQRRENTSERVRRDEYRVLASALEERADSDVAKASDQLTDLAESVLDANDLALFRMAVDGLSLSEMASRLGIGYANAGVKLYRMRKRLRTAEAGARAQKKMAGMKKK